MSEFDFDELDRAVSTLMDKATAKSADDSSPVTASTSTDDTTVSDDSTSLTDASTVAPERASPTPANDMHHTAQASARPTDDEEDSESEGSETSASDIELVDNEESAEDVTPEISGESKDSTEVPESEPVQSDDELIQDDGGGDVKQKVIPHRTGRFMDMKTNTSTAASPVSRMPSRQGVTVSPTHDDIKPEETQLTEISPMESEHSFEAAKSDFPDPIDMMSGASKTVGDESSEEGTEVSETTPDEQSQETVASQPETARSDFSPFLSDVKPEKRPLGAAADGIPGDEQASGGEDSIDATRPADPVEDEFDNRLMAIESGNIEKQLPAGDDDTSEADTTHDDDVVAPKPAETTPLRPTGPISIPQQYDEQPSSGPDSNGAIFDTAAYHQPLEHPVKKSNGLLRVVLIVVVILVVGGVAGAIFYFGHL